MILVLSDLHLGINEYQTHRKNQGSSEEIKNIFETLNEKVETLVITGDLFDSRTPANKLEKIVKETFEVIQKKIKPGTRVFYIATDHDTVYKKHYFEIIRPGFKDVFGKDPTKQIVDMHGAEKDNIPLEGAEITGRRLTLTFKEKKILFIHGNAFSRIWRVGMGFEQKKNRVTKKISELWIRNVLDRLARVHRHLAEIPTKREQNSWVSSIQRFLNKAEINVSAVVFGHIHRPFIRRKNKETPLMVSLGSWGLYSKPDETKLGEKEKKQEEKKRKSKGIKTFATISDDLEVKLYSLNHKDGKEPIATGEIL